jgi:hypothetical protein
MSPKRTAAGRNASGAIIVDRITQLAHPADVGDHLFGFANRHAVELEPVATARLRFPARDVGLRQDLVMVESVRDNHRDADAALYMEHVVVLDVCKPPHVFENCLRQFPGFTLVHAGCQHGKFVATETCDDAFVVNGSFQLVRDFTNEAIG